MQHRRKDLTNLFKSLSVKILQNKSPTKGKDSATFKSQFCLAGMTGFPLSSLKIRYTDPSSSVWKIENQSRIRLPNPIRLYFPPRHRQPIICQPLLWIDKLIYNLEKPSFKKYRNFMKYFHKTVPPPPPYCIYEILIQISPLILGHLLFLNKRYEIRLTPPPVCEKIS